MYNHKELLEKYSDIIDKVYIYKLPVGIMYINIHNIININTDDIKEKTDIMMFVTQELVRVVGQTILDIGLDKHSFISISDRAIEIYNSTTDHTYVDYDKLVSEEFNIVIEMFVREVYNKLTKMIDDVLVINDRLSLLELDYYCKDYIATGLINDDIIMFVKMK